MFLNRGGSLLAENRGSSFLTEVQLTIMLRTEHRISTKNIDFFDLFNILPLESLYDSFILMMKGNKIAKKSNVFQFIE